MNYIQKHSADVLKTHGENKNVKKITNYKSFKNIYLAIDETFEWYKKNNIYEID